jgi:hypothetical protein
VKLLHRICVDCKRPAMAFQASMFRTFQRALRAQRQGGMDAVASKVGELNYVWHCVSHTDLWTCGLNFPLLV